MGVQEPEPDEDEVAWHREMDRIVDQWDDEPTHEKWRRGAKWK
jgi:hypothetical protein